MNKLIMAMLLVLVFLSGCDDSKNAPVVNKMDANFLAKEETLSSDNEVDIRADLTALNSIINGYNTKASDLSQKLMAANREGDNDTIENLLKESRKLLESTNKSLLDLNLKSSEIQKIRLDIYHGNRIANNALNLFYKKNKSELEKQELISLQKEVIALQKTVGATLDQLNSQYY